MLILGVRCCAGWSCVRRKPLAWKGLRNSSKAIEGYLGGLELLVDEENPVVRTNVTPFDHARDKVSLFAFSRAAPNTVIGRPTFVVVAGLISFLELAAQDVVD